MSGSRVVGYEAAKNLLTRRHATATRWNSLGTLVAEGSIGRVVKEPVLIQHGQGLFLDMTILEMVLSRRLSI